MKIYSVHSHKGGVGKTTFSLLLSKYLAQVKKEKTCLIDMDFQAQGLRSSYLRENLKYDFSDFLMADENAKKEIAGQIAVKHEEIDNLYFIANLFKPRADIKNQQDIIRKVYLKVVNEIYTGEITDSLNELKEYLKKAGFKNIIIDDHPGLVLLSEEIIKNIKTIPIFITTQDIVSLVGLFKNILGRYHVWGIALTELKIILNRVPSNGFTGFSKQIDHFIDSSEAAPDEKLICSEIKKQFLNGENRLMIIPENDEISQMDTMVNPRTLLDIDIPVDLKTVLEQILR
ncbi:MAG: ParA family protein [Acidobacteria bacterium]|jgi:cellulose biosynthesis protein BcsQ|nr:ParA family protein [Acidobacteriota bacterium]